MRLLSASIFSSWANSNFVSGVSSPYGNGLPCAAIAFPARSTPAPIKIHFPRRVMAVTSHRAR